MHIFLIIATILGYIFIARFSYGIFHRVVGHNWDRYNDDNIPFIFATVLWPIGIPFALICLMCQREYSLGYHFADWIISLGEKRRTRVAENQKRLADENKRLRIALQEAEQEVEETLRQKSA